MSYIINRSHIICLKKEEEEEYHLIQMIYSQLIELVISKGERQRHSSSHDD